MKVKDFGKIQKEKKRMPLTNFLYEFRWILIIPVITMSLSLIFKITKEIAQGAYHLDIKDELEKRIDEKRKEEEQKIEIDKDLQKYFNYKE